MKKVTRLAAMWGLALGFLLFPLTPTVHAQAQGQQPNEQQPNEQQPSQEKTRAFVGEVVKAKNGQYALLIDKHAGTGFYLDNQEEAKKFEGQNVKVTGTLDASRNLIHVSNIQPA